MGFFAKLTGGCAAYKAGRKHAMEGNLDKALVYFDDAVRQSKEAKNLHENRMYYYLVHAIIFSKEGNVEKAKQAYSQFKLSSKDLLLEYGENPGFGARARAITTANCIKELIIKYSADLEWVSDQQA